MAMIRDEVKSRIDSIEESTPLTLFKLLKSPEVSLRGRSRKAKLNSYEYNYLKDKILLQIERFVKKGDYKKLLSMFLRRSIFKEIPDFFSNYAKLLIPRAFLNHMKILAKRGDFKSLEDIRNREHNYKEFYLSVSLSPEQREKVNDIYSKEIWPVIEKNYLKLYDKAAENFVKKLVSGKSLKRNVIAELDKIIAQEHPYERFPPSAISLAYNKMVEVQKSKLSPKRKYKKTAFQKKFEHYK